MMAKHAFLVQFILLGGLLCAHGRLAAAPDAAVPDLDGHKLEQIALQTGQELPTPELRAAVNVLVKAGYFKTNLFQGLKPVLGIPEPFVGPMTPEKAVAIAKPFAPVDAPRVEYRVQNNLHVVIFYKVGTGDLDPTVAHYFAIDSNGKIVKKGVTSGNGITDNINRALSSDGDSGPHVW